MAIYLFKLIRRKLREREAQKIIPTSDETHLVPEYALGSRNGQQQSATESQNVDAVHSIGSQTAARQKQEARQRTIRLWKLVLGLALPNFLAAVDVTIVAPAIPLISSHFNQLSGGFNWVVAAYTLTFTTFVPASGQLADIYGRHFALQFEMFWIVVGSVLCAAAQSWSMLLVGRALQGLGAAGIMSLSRIILSDGATLTETAKGNTIMSLIGGISYAVGPVIGGHLVEVGWRYLFVIPAAIAVLAMAIIFFAMRKELVHGRASHKSGSRRSDYISGLAIIDWPGMIMFILGIGCIILAIQWGGTQYSWSSAAVVAPLVAGTILCVTFFTYEYLLGPGRAVARMFPNQVPMIPSTLFRKKDTPLLMIINFSAGISLVCAFYFISYYFQFAEGYSASQAGTQLLYYTPGLGVGVYTAMILCNRWPRQTFFPLMWGSIVEAVGLVLLTWSISTRQQMLVKVFLAVSGAGTGLRFMPIVLHAAGIWSTRIPNMQSLLSFMLPLGETIGISMMGSVFSNKLDVYLGRIQGLPQDFTLHTSGTSGLDILDNPALKNSIQNGAAKAVMWSLISVLPFVGLSIIASIFLGNVWIGKAAKQSKDGKIEKEAVKGQVMYSVYVHALVSGSVKAHKQDLDSDVERAEKTLNVEDSGVAAPHRVRAANEPWV